MFEIFFFQNWFPYISSFWIPTILEIGIKEKMENSPEIEIEIKIEIEIEIER